METLKPKLPREFLWTDKNSMEDFFELDPVNEFFYQYIAYLILHQDHRLMKSGVAYFNEAYYQVTRMVYE